MLGRFWNYLFATIFGLAAVGGASAVEINGSQYSVYVGDVNGDYIQDIYLKVPDTFVLLHDDVSVPLLIDAEEPSFLIASVGASVPYYSDPIIDESVDINELVMVDDLVSLSFVDDDSIADLVFIQAHGIIGELVVNGNLANASSRQIISFNQPVPTLSTAAHDPANTSIGSAYNGALRGEHTVGIDGSFNYKLPLDVPAGVNGVRPDIALTYNSNGTNGLVGLGWSLTGLASIQRCPASLVRDGYVSGVRYEDDFRFCFNGERLILTRDGEYRTEEDNFAKIFPQGSNPKAPTSWKIQFSDGRTYTLGGTSQAKISDSAGRPMMWFKSREENALGHGIEYEYEHDSDGDDHRIKRIRYTKDYQNNAFSSLHYIEFDYESRFDDLVRYMSGKKITTDHRLNKITMFSFGQEVWHYDLDYWAYHSSTHADPTRASRLKSVALDTGVSVIPLEFEWTSSKASTYNFTPRTDSVGVMAFLEKYNSGGEFSQYSEPELTVAEIDLDGDLVLDYVVKVTDGLEGEKTTPERLYVHYSKTGETKLLYTKPGGQWVLPFPEFIDVNGDSLMDLVMTPFYGTKFWAQDLNLLQSDRFYLVFVNKGSHFQDPYNYGLSLESDLSWQGELKGTHGTDISIRGSYRYTHADFNGDGLVDIMRRAVRGVADFGELEFGAVSGNIAINKGNGEYGEFTQWSGTDDIATDFLHGHQVRDINGDNLPDIVLKSNRVLINSGKPSTGFIEDSRYRPDYAYESSDKNIVMADVNGDGLADQIKITSDRLAHDRPLYSDWLLYNEGLGYNDKKRFVLNWDDNWKSDLSSNKENNLSIKVRINTGNELLPEQTWSSLKFRRYPWCELQWYSYFNLDTETNHTVHPYEPNFSRVMSLDSSVRDINGDGMMDFIFVDTPEACSTMGAGLDDGQHIRALISTGKGFVYREMSFGDNEKISVFTTNQPSQELRARFGVIYDADANRDGVTDLQYSRNRNGTTYAYSNVKKPYMVRVSNSLGYTVDVDYQALANRTKNADGDYEGIYTASGWTPGSANVSVQNLSYTGTANSFDFQAGGSSNSINDIFPDAYSMAAFQQTASDGLRGRYAVAKVEASTGSSESEGKLVTSYHYSNARYHAAGYGNLGFQSVRKTIDKGELGEVSTLQTFNQTASELWNLSGKLLSEQVYATRPTGGRQRISHRRLSWSHVFFPNDKDEDYISPHFYPYILDDETKTYALENGALLSTHIKSLHYSGNSYDTNKCRSFRDFGNNYRSYSLINFLDPSSGVPREIIEAYCDKYGVTGVFTKNNEVTNKVGSGAGQEYQVLGLVQNPVETSWHYEKSSQITDSKTRSSRFSFDSFGRVMSESIEPDGTADLSLLKSYTYDDYGLVKSLTETFSDFDNDGLNFDARWTSYTRTLIDDPTKSDPFSKVWSTVTTNPLNHSTTELTDPVRGNQVRFTDANGLEINTTYDSLGRKKSVTFPGGSTQYSYAQCYGSPCTHTVPSIPQVWRWYAQEKTTGKMAMRTYYDYLDREMGRQSFGLNGDATHTNVDYDKFGNITRAIAPWRSGDAIQMTRTVFDILDRPVSTLYPNDGVQTIEYSQLNTTSTDSLGKTLVRRFDAMSREKEVIDHDGTAVKYRHDGLGNVVRVEIAPSSGDSLVHTIEYDILSRKTALVDPDVGRIEYTYNALGLLATQVNAEDEEIHYEYDKLGRQIGRWDNAQAANAGDRYHQWIFDNKSNGVGLLGSVDGKDTNGNPHRIELTYNSRSLLKDKTHFIDGRQYKVTEHYDIFNRRRGVTYPTGFTLAYGYNVYGGLSSISDAGSGDLLWQAIEDDAFGNTTEFNFGNGVKTVREYDPETGLVDSINVSKQNTAVQNHEYSFDKEGNLRQRKDLVHSVTQNFCYDNLYRVTDAPVGGSCSDITDRNYGNADFAYDAHGNITKKDGINDYLYGVNAGPHAVTRANGSTYKYDLAGRMTSGGGRLIEYSAFGKPSYMAWGSYQTNVVYGAEQMRVRRGDIDSGELTSTVYVDKLYERIETDKGVKHRHYIEDFGVHVIDESLNDDFNIFLSRDHIGSIAAKTYGDVSANQGIDWLANEPWGRRQDKHWGGETYDRLTGDALEQMTFGTARGFTDHEHLDGVGLIHMNGRVYDPIVGRFVSPDPWIQDPKNSQSFNRYSYVWNNPLRYTDPTGEFIPIVIGIVKVVSWGVTAYGAYETAKDVKQTVDDLRNGEISGKEATANIGKDVAENLLLSKGKIATKFIPDNLADTVADKANDLTKNLNSKVDPVSKTQKTDVDKPKNESSNQNVDSRCCFVAGTLILTNEGYVPIEEIKLGDLVLSKNTVTGEVKHKPVVQLFKKYRPILELRVLSNSGEEELIETTEDHPFYVNGIGWVTAAELQSGYAIETTKDQHVFVSSVIQTKRLETTYNFEVRDFHAYYVTKLDLLVHNQNGDNCDPSKGPSGESGDSGGAEAPKSRGYDRPEVETKSGKAVRQKNATDEWDNFLGDEQTNIDPRDGLPDPDRIWSADGKRSIRFGEHEMNSKPNKLHYHQETWHEDEVENVLQRIPQ